MRRIAFHTDYIKESPQKAFTLTINAKHEYNAKNTYTHTDKNGKMSRYCKKCLDIKKRKRRARQRELGLRVN